MAGYREKHKSISRYCLYKIVVRQHLLTSIFHSLVTNEITRDKKKLIPTGYFDINDVKVRETRNNLD